MAVVLDVELGGLCGVVDCVLVMAVSGVSVMCGGFMVAGLVVLGGVAMMLCGVSEVLGGLVMMLGCLL